MRIVYVEDNIANVHLVKRVARMGKHEVISYIDGMDALNNFETDTPDLVLMDIQLAGELTGIEVVEKLREKGFKTPIFAVTAYAMVGDKERCMEAGCTGYMSKPIPVPDLVKLFEEFTPSASQTEIIANTPSETVKPIESTSTTTITDDSSTLPATPVESNTTKQKIDPVVKSTVQPASKSDDKADTQPAKEPPLTGSTSAASTNALHKTQTTEPIPSADTNKVSDNSKLIEANSEPTPTSQESNDDKQAKMQ